MQANICKPINPPSSLFRYFSVLIDASKNHVEVALLTTRNLVFPRIHAILLRYKNHFSDHHVKFFRMNDALEFKFYALEDNCTVFGISLTYSFPYEHSQNGLLEAFIKKLQLIFCPLFFHAKFPDSFKGHAIIHVAALLKLRPILFNHLILIDFLAGRPPNVTYFPVFGCHVWIPVPAT